MNNYKDIQQKLVNYESTDAQYFLQGLKNNDEFVIWSSIKGCGLKKLKDSTHTLINFLKVPAYDFGDTDNRLISAWSLGQFGFDNLTNHINLNKIPFDNILLNQGIADTLGMTSDKRALPYLDKLLQSDDFDTLLWASLSVSKIGTDGIGLLEMHLNKSKSLNKITFIVDALIKIKSSEAINVVKSYLSSSKYKKELKEIFDIKKLPQQK